MGIVNSSYKGFDYANLGSSYATSYFASQNANNFQLSNTYNWNSAYSSYPTYSSVYSGCGAFNGLNRWSFSPSTSLYSSYSNSRGFSYYTPFSSRYGSLSYSTSSSSGRNNGFGLSFSYTKPSFS